MARPRARAQLGRLAAGAAVAVLMKLSPAQAAAPVCPVPWPAWETFKQQFVSADGRVIDPSTPRHHTTSEGQAYALFFALVANDRAAFDRLLRWTEDNLAAGDLGGRLPAWQWGRHDDATWRVLDPNAAADADLWLAYTLGEAAQLWGERRHRALASLLAARIVREEVRALPGYGAVLLPGPQGFGPEPRDGRLHARLNASYLPLPLLRRFAVRLGGIWDEVLRTSLQIIEASAPLGYAADWLRYESDPAQRTGALRLPDDAAQRSGSYDAIRVYLWLGISSSQDPAQAALLARLRPMADWIERHGAPPEAVDPRDGQAHGEGPSGFSAATLPFLAASRRSAALQQQQQRLRRQPPRDMAYYEQALALFGQGFQDERYRFERDGTLLPAWTTCTTPPSLSR